MKKNWFSILTLLVMLLSQICAPFGVEPASADGPPVGARRPGSAFSTDPDFTTELSMSEYVDYLRTDNPCKGGFFLNGGGFSPTGALYQAMPWLECRGDQNLTHYSIQTPLLSVNEITPNHGLVNVPMAISYDWSPGYCNRHSSIDLASFTVETGDGTIYRFRRYTVGIVLVSGQTHNHRYFHYTDYSDPNLGANYYGNVGFFPSWMDSAAINNLFFLTNKISPNGNNWTPGAREEFDGWRTSGFVTIGGLPQERSEADIASLLGLPVGGVQLDTCGQAHLGGSGTFYMKFANPYFNGFVPTASSVNGTVRRNGQPAFRIQPVTHWWVFTKMHVEEVWEYLPATDEWEKIDPIPGDTKPHEVDSEWWGQGSFLNYMVDDRSSGGSNIRSFIPVEVYQSQPVLTNR